MYISRMEEVIIVARYEKLGDPYIRVRLSDGRVVGEQRFVMERAQGRRLLREELVHHKDENKRNNRLSNLEIKTLHEHTKLHHPRKRPRALTCPVCGSKFARSERYIRTKERGGQRSFFCGRRCRVSRKLLGGMPDSVHGRRVGYTYWGCRCDRCHEAQRDYMRSLRS
jgi:hypothetical protein